MNKVKLKFKSTIPPRLENALYDFGFAYHSRKQGDWVIYEKVVEPSLTITTVEEDVDEDEEKFGVPREVLDRLKARLNRIIDAYVDPYGNMAAIRAQCMMVANSLPELERDFVFDWVTNNLDSEFFSPPWEDENYQPNLEGFC